VYSTSVKQVIESAQEKFPTPFSMDTRAKIKQRLTDVINKAVVPGVRVQPAATSRPVDGAQVVDDADDDVKVAIPSSSSGNAEAAPTERSTTPPGKFSPSEMGRLKGKQRRDILAIVTGSRSPGKEQPDEEYAEERKKSDSKERQVSKSEAKLESSSGKGVDKKKARKKAPNPTRRVLIARKEKDAARKLLKDKQDLLDILPRDDCKFLADRLWIFTEEQLVAVLDSTSITKDGPAGPSDLVTEAQEIRKVLVNELAKRIYVERNPNYKAVVKKNDLNVVSRNSGTAERAEADSAKPSQPQVDAEGGAKPLPKEDTSETGQIGGTDSERGTSTAPKSQPKDAAIQIEEAAPYKSQPQSNSKAEVNPRDHPLPEDTRMSDVEEKDERDVEMEESELQTAAEDAGAASKARNPFNIEMEESKLQTTAEDAGAASKARNPFNMPPLNSSVSQPQSPDHQLPSYVLPKLSVPHMSKKSTITPWVDQTHHSYEPRIPVDKEDIARAEARLEEWKKLVDSAVHGGSTSRSSISDRFPLDGPISCLLPTSTQNFLASVKVSSLYEFLSMRRTETGAICDMLRVWREECGLSDLNHLALAKHFLGVSSRLEVAICSVVPIDKKTQRWMNDPIIVMTGAAREFLVDHLSIITARQFIETRTKELSEKLVEWREKKGLVPLKGSGKVAMVSGWKACAREEVEAQEGNGKIITDVDLEAISARDTPIIRDETAVSTKSSEKVEESSNKKPRPLQANLQVDYASHSQLFVEHVLGKDVASFLSSININTAAELEKVKTGPDSILYQRMRETKRVTNLSDFYKCILEWRSKLQRHLNEMTKEPKESEEQSTKNISLPKQPKVVAKSTAKAPSKSKSKAKASSKATAKAPSKSSGKAPSKSTAKAPPPAPVRRSDLSDPYDGLSLATKHFLGSVGITSGEQFLSTRTTEIAAEFVKWRVQEGKPELKGLGAIASVSGWKAACRKAATDMGLTDIAAMEPDNKASWSIARSPKPKPKPPKGPSTAKLMTGLPLHVSSEVTNEKVLSGKSRLEFAVQKSQGKTTNSCALDEKS
jgi:hypothetical protein